jgi:L-lactate dehydrogenase complex protein LldE
MTHAPPPSVTFLATCVADRFFADACWDAITVLEHFGVSVSVPLGQTCCGQPAHNTGRREEATRMARHTTRVAGQAGAVVLPSGSCAGMIRSCYPSLLSRDTSLKNGSIRERGAEETSTLPDRVRELSEFLVHDLGVLGRRWSDSGEATPRLGSGLEGMRVAYHHGCHALRELGVRDEPLALLRACGARVESWDGDMECCGFGGLFSAKFPEVSAGMADRKLDSLPEDVDVVTSADGGCLLQLSGRAGHRATGGEPSFTHLATLLRRGLT